MIAVDTNVLVRLVVRDDDVQARRAAALDLLEAGTDFADALHLASSRETAQFATFDKRLKKRADTAAPGYQVREA